MYAIQFVKLSEQCQLHPYISLQNFSRDTTFLPHYDLYNDLRNAPHAENINVQYRS